MAEELVTVIYDGPDPIKPIRDSRTNETFNFIKGETRDVSKEFAATLTKSGEGSEFNSRGLTAEQLDLARSYDHHLFRIVPKTRGGMAVGIGG